MNGTRRLRHVAMLLFVAMFSGYVLLGCHEEEPKPNNGGYYTGPLKGKGAPKNAGDTTGDSKTPQP
jgi:hypothetical protein